MIKSKSWGIKKSSCHWSSWRFRVYPWINDVWNSDNDISFVFGGKMDFFFRSLI